MVRQGEYQHGRSSIMNELKEDILNYLGGIVSITLMSIIAGGIGLIAALPILLAWAFVRTELQGVVLLVGIIVTLLLVKKILASDLYYHLMNICLVGAAFLLFFSFYLTFLLPCAIGMLIFVLLIRRHLNHPWKIR